MVAASKLAGFALVVAFTASVSWAETDPLSVDVKEKNSVAYVSGGVGVDQQQDIAEKGANFSLKMTFATPDGHYLGGGRVTILDAEGTQVLNVSTDGPIFYADLEPGKYTVTAEPQSYEAQRSERTVEIGDNQSVLHFSWTIGNQ